MSSNIRIKKTCLECGNEFIAKTTVTRCCSDTCAKRNWKRRQREKKIKEAIKLETNVKPQHIKHKDLKDKELYSIKEAITFIGISKSTIYRLFDDKKLVKIKVRNRIFIRRKDIYKTFKL